ncbi:MAG: hypothetical protein ABI779_15835, partial [Acidobacteriota bacterium]
MLRTAEEIEDRDTGEPVREDRRRDVIDFDAVAVERDHAAEPPPPQRSLREHFDLIGEPHHIQHFMFARGRP